MNEFKNFLTAQALVIIGLITALFITVFCFMNREPDVIAANNYIQTVKENWDNLSVLQDRALETDILVLDLHDRIVYTSSEEVFDGITSPLDAMKKNMLTFAVNDEEQFLGTIIMPDPSKIRFDHALIKLFLVAVCLMAILLLSYAAFFFYINRNIIKPFQRMKKCAALIAQGKLDEPLFMERSNIFGLFTESFDTMREELKASKDRELALMLKEKELVASLSHDLKTPVTGIKLICELLEAKLEDEYIKGKIAAIDHKTEEIFVLLNNLLSSALEDLTEMQVSLSEMTSDLLGKLLDEHDPRKKITAKEVPGCILIVDKNRLSQVIGNIISNSYKYADTQIDVTYRFYDNQNQEKFLEMKISDHGEGVSPDELPLLTNKFYRGKNNAAQKEGSGLGLYISKELMKKMNGQLICQSDMEGFSVTLLIPLA